MGETTTIPPIVTPQVFPKAIRQIGIALDAAIGTIPIPDDLDDQVTLSSQVDQVDEYEEEPSPPSTDGITPGAEGAVTSSGSDCVNSAFHQFNRLVPGRQWGVEDYRAYHESWFAEDRDGDGLPEVDISSNDFESGLANFLGVREGDINNAPLDAIFGNQDGGLNGDDLLTEEQFIERLEIAARYFEVSSRTRGGQSFSTFLRNDTVVFVNTSVLANGVNVFQFNALLTHLLQNPENENYTEALARLKDMWGAAGSAWIALEEGLVAEDRETLNRDVTYDLGILCDEEAVVGERMNAAEDILQIIYNNEDVFELLFFAYVATLETDLVQHQNDIAGNIDWDDPVVAGNFMSGVLTDYVLVSSEGLERNDSIDEDIFRERAEANAPVWAAINGTGPTVTDDAVLPDAVDLTQ